MSEEGAESREEDLALEGVLLVLERLGGGFAFEPGFLTAIVRIQLIFRKSCLISLTDRNILTLPA